MEEHPTPNSPEGAYPRTAPKVYPPWWVRLSIWGSPNRAWVIGFFWFSIVCAALLLIGGLFLWPLLLLAPVVAICGLPYLLSVRWMDRYDGWSQRTPKDMWKL